PLTGALDVTATVIVIDEIPPLSVVGMDQIRLQVVRLGGVVCHPESLSLCTGESVRWRTLQRIDAFSFDGVKAKGLEGVTVLRRQLPPACRSSREPLTLPASSGWPFSRRAAVLDHHKRIPESRVDC